jgi:DNA segregation ATPase FtsK/SpoIIIE, S-DNA-T family
MARKRSFLGRKKSYGIKLKKNTVYSISAVLLFSIAGLVWISFIRQGLLLTRLNTLLLEQLGLVPSLFLPFPLIVGGMMVTRIKSFLSEPHVFVGSLIVIAALTGLFHDGLLGNQLWLNSGLFLSVPGSFLFLLAGFGIGLLVMLNIPFEDILNFFVKLTARGEAAPAQIKVTGLTPQIKTKIPEPKGGAPSSGKPDFVVKGLPEKSASGASKSDGFQPQPMATGPAGAANAPWHYPPISLLSDNISGKADRGNVNANAAKIEETLEAFGISAHVAEVNLGPAVTQYALEVAIGTKLSKINALSNDLALALAAPTGQIRIEAPIAGRSLVGIELPNRSPEFVSLRKVMEDDRMKHHKSKLAVAMGLDVSGQTVVADIAKMPHVLIAGQTGSGKSVMINTFIASLLYRCSPQELNLIFVDPKRVELTGYNGIPHLLAPVIVEPDKVLSALKWAMAEMDHRYKMFAEVGARNLEGYNELSGFQALPYIVIFIDELADIMLFAPVEVEDAITRIAQMARATGIHLVIATQRPSVDIITGLIKANIPTRIAFAVSSMIDSRVIIDQPGAEKLLGRGDMLYIPPDQAKPTRIQGALISDKEIKQLIEYLKKQGVAPNYTEEVTNQPINTKRGGKGSAFIGPSGEDRDELFEEAFRLVLQHEVASASFLQRKLSIGYARAAKILDQMQNAGLIGPGEGAKPREILVRQLPDENASQVEASVEQ